MKDPGSSKFNISLETLNKCKTKEQKVDFSKQVHIIGCPYSV